jgi:putative thiamine transport system permease protein
MSVVDMAVILGPTRPAPLAVQVVTWISDPDLQMHFIASAGATVMLVSVLVTLALWYGAERLVARGGRYWSAAGGRGAFSERPVRAVSLVFALVAVLSVGVGMLGLLIWSFAGLWRFPDVLPTSYRMTTWMREGPALGATAVDTATIGAVSVGISLVLVIACLEAETRLKRKMTARGVLILYLPLLVPQIGFMPGLQTLALGFGLDGGMGSVIAAHVVFVLPYIFLSLSDPWRSLDPAFDTVAASLGSSANRVLFRVRLPLLLRPILTAAAVGFAVSIGQYLPTLLIGGGRVETLTTEAVALSSGGNRRIIGVYAWSQMMLPFIAFALALVVPAFIYRRRRGMAVA